ncbi:hypothetical protein C7974DRAFT_370804 [Boeremia exigua]|uniref:uncharacterized protein n=1 Tax=Boeremia exigua TaxID=749465 RepID=UPI001E8DC981|nr:uncharacterized protein C7974DRAFT_370804 [Boeremia exigua]KAH6643567.1 hypothetical protein C7974DRAFT_370804 [Boeremia exigua]
MTDANLKQDITNLSQPDDSAQSPLGREGESTGGPASAGNSIAPEDNLFKNDLKSPSSDPASCLPEIIELSKLTLERAKAQKWAFEDIKFLVFDDTGDESGECKETDVSRAPTSAPVNEHDCTQPHSDATLGAGPHQDEHADGYDSDVEEQMMAYAMDLSREGNSDDHNARPGVASRTENTGRPETPCRVCSSYPEFPYRSKPRTFRLVKPTVTDVCTHYVAISYCWPPADEQLPMSNYLVRDIDGRQRPSRALDDVLDRAVDFANSCGLRMIWIDQECLPQPNKDSPQADKDEQQLGVQSMDIVYNRATVTAGLLDVKIDSLWQIKTITALMRSTDDSARRIPNQEAVRHLLDFLYRTSQDRWYTRAWVIQESLCAGSKLALAFRLGPGLNSSATVRQSRDTKRPPHSLDVRTEQYAAKLFIVPLLEFWRVLDKAKQLLAHAFVHSGRYLIRTNNGPACEIIINIRSTHRTEPEGHEPQ